MLSIDQLPANYIENMKELLGNDFSLYEQSIGKPSYIGIRVNNRKISTEDFVKICPFNIRKIPYIDNGFYIEDANEQPAKHPYYFAGLYYIQEPSAMLPAYTLKPEASDKVLDLCAAPGGKATQLGSATQRLLVANDISRSRAIALDKNVELSGCPYAYITAEDPAVLKDEYSCYFDKILVDAPCSGEGMFRKDPSLIESWKLKGPKYYAPLQKSILTDAVAMLKGNGYLLYSTCTFSPSEDEEVIDYILSDESLELVPIVNDISFEKGIFKENYQHDLSLCARIYPHKIDGEGHFMALIHKKPDENEHENKLCRKMNGKLIPLDEKKDRNVYDFLRSVSEPRLTGNLYKLNDLVISLPADYEFDYRQSVRYVRSGNIIGSINKAGKMTPSTSLALLLSPECFDNVLNLSDKDERCIKYLKGETLFTASEDNIHDGYVLICVNGYSLGFGNLSGGKIKNLYDRSRIMK